MNEVEIYFKNPLLDKFQFWKEITLAMLIFALPFLVYMHIFFVDSAFDNEFKQLETEVYNDDGFADFLCLLLNNTTYLLYFLIFMLNFKNSYRFLLLTPTFWFGSSVLFVLYYKSFEVVEPYMLNFLILTAISTLLVIFFKFKKGSLGSKTLGVLAPFLFLIIITIFLEICRNYTQNSPLVEIFGGFGFEEPSQGIFHLTKRVLVFFTVLFWFFFEKGWWKYSLLSPIIITACQLYNHLTNFSAPLDELELGQAAPFLITLALLLILLSESIKHQYAIKSKLIGFRKSLESKIEARYSRNQQFIEEKNKEMLNSKNDMAKMEKLKLQLEQRLRAMEL